MNFLIFLEAHTQNRRRSPHFSTFSFEIHESNVSYHRSSTNIYIISKRKRPQDRRRGTFIRTHGHGERQQFSWNRRSGRSWRKREREGEPGGNVETKRKVEERKREREREHFLYEEARLFTSAGTKWKMLDSTRSEQY